MTHKSGSEYDVVGWYKESIVDQIKRASNSDAAENAKAAAGIALAWAVGFGYLTGKIVESGAKKSATVTRRIIDEAVAAGATFVADGREQSGEIETPQRSKGSFLAAIGVDVERVDISAHTVNGLGKSIRISGYPLVRVPQITSLSIEHFEGVFVPETVVLSDLSGVE